MKSPAARDRDIEALFAVPVSACVATPEMREAVLTVGEAMCVARAKPERRAEFASGRAAARIALDRLGLKVASIPSQADRSPLWPPGHVGSISHCDGFCAAVAASVRHAGSVGLDAELARPLPETVGRLVCSDADGPQSPALRTNSLWPTIVFSAKEAAYKCQFPLSREVLGFAVAVVLPAEGCQVRGGAFGVQFGPTAPACLAGLVFRGAWRILGGLVLTAVWLPPPGQDKET